MVGSKEMHDNMEKALIDAVEQKCTPFKEDLQTLLKKEV
jgi:hypothetical protein